MRTHRPHQTSPSLSRRACLSVLIIIVERYMTCFSLHIHPQMAHNNKELGRARTILSHTVHGHEILLYSRPFTVGWKTKGGTSAGTISYKSATLWSLVIWYVVLPNRPTDLLRNNGRPGRTATAVGNCDRSVYSPLLLLLLKLQLLPRRRGDISQSNWALTNQSPLTLVMSVREVGRAK